MIPRPHSESRSRPTFACFSAPKAVGKRICPQKPYSPQRSEGSTTSYASSATSSHSPGTRNPSHSPAQSWGEALSPCLTQNDLLFAPKHADFSMHRFVPPAPIEAIRISRYGSATAPGARWVDATDRFLWRPEIQWAGKARCEGLGRATLRGDSSFLSACRARRCREESAHPAPTSAPRESTTRRTAW